MQFRAAGCGHPALRGTGSTVGDDVGIVPCETMARNVAHNTADAECIPAASGQRGPRERPADGAAETIRKQSANFAHPGPRGKRRPTWTTPQPRKGFQNLVLAAFFPPFLFAAERKGAVGDIKTAALGERIATGGDVGHWLAMTGITRNTAQARAGDVGIAPTQGRETNVPRWAGALTAKMFYAILKSEYTVPPHSSDRKKEI